MVLRARFDGKVFIPEGPVALAGDRLVDMDIREVESPPRGSREAILRMLRELPPLEPGDADALMAAINGAEIPPERGGVFDEDEPLSGSK